MGRNGTAASVLVDEIKSLFDRARTDLERIARDYPHFTPQIVRVLDELEREVVERSVGYFYVSGVLQGIERTLIAFITPESGHFEDLRWLEGEVERLLPPGSAGEPFLTESGRDGRSILARLRDKLSRGF